MSNRLNLELVCDSRLRLNMYLYSIEHNGNFSVDNLWLGISRMYASGKNV